MEEIYANIEEYEGQTSNMQLANQTGPRSSERSFHRAMVLCLGLLSVFLLVGLIILGIHYRGIIHDSKAELFMTKANLTERLQASNDKLSSVSKERDLLNANLTEMTKELHRLQSLSKQKKTCPPEWRVFNCNCYFFSAVPDSWEKARQDCRGRGADLVMIESYEEQEFLSKVIKQNTWIGLNDRDNKNTWKWSDGTPLTLAYWAESQPDHGGGNPTWGEEDCAHLKHDNKPEKNWNDLNCDNKLQWICEF